MTMTAKRREPFNMSQEEVLDEAYTLAINTSIVREHVDSMLRMHAEKPEFFDLETLHLAVNSLKQASDYLKNGK